MTTRMIWMTTRPQTRMTIVVSKLTWLTQWTTALALLMSAFQVPAHADDWTAPLEDALALDAEGYTFLAIERLESLEVNHEKVLRLKLELAAMYLKVGQADKAAHYIDDVLEDPNLPVKVRINAQMLQLKIQAAQNAAKQELRTTFSLSGGYEAENRTAFTQFQGWTQLTRDLPTLNLGGRPLPARMVFNGASMVNREFETDQQAWLVKFDGGLFVTTNAVKLGAGAGYQVSSAIDGPLLFTSGQWRSEDWRLKLVSQWLYQGDGWDTSHRLSLNRTISPHWRLAGWARHRTFPYDPDTPVRSIGFGQTLRNESWTWQNDVEWDVDKRIWSGETGLYWQISEAWRLGSTLGAGDFSYLNNEWYSEVSIRWSR